MGLDWWLRNVRRGVHLGAVLHVCSADQLLLLLFLVLMCLFMLLLHPLLPVLLRRLGWCWIVIHGGHEALFRPFVAQRLANGGCISLDEQNSEQKEQEDPHTAILTIPRDALEFVFDTCF